MSDSPQRQINVDEIFEQQSLGLAVDRERVESQIRQFKHHNLRGRGEKVLGLTDHISQMSYHEYRLLAGTINFMRDDEDSPSWSQIITQLSQFHEEVKSYAQLSVIVDLLVEMASEEVMNLKVKRNFKWSSQPQLLSMATDEFVHQILFIVRTFYPLGVNILHPSMIEDDTSDYCLNSSQSIVFEVGAHKKLSMRSDGQGAGFVISLDDATKDMALEPIRLKKGQSALIGRRGISVKSLLGLPVSHRTLVDLDVESSVWSRGALLIVCDREGRLFLFDRAAKNPFRFKLFSDDADDDYSRGMYTPAFILSPPSEEHHTGAPISRLVGEIVYDG
jgi:hypothetical protein